MDSPSVPGPVTNGTTGAKRPYAGSSSESVVSFAADSATQVSVSNSLMGADGRRATKSVPSSTGCRQRVTVVCGECKRLKLKCDRRTPCGSCTKRDTIPRCIYSQEASAKVDVQSLNIRLQAVETKLNGVPDLSAPGSGAGASSSRAGVPDKPRAFLAVGGHGASVAVNLEGVAGLWVDHLGLNTAAARAVPTGDGVPQPSGGIDLLPFPTVPDEGVIDLFVEYTKLFKIPSSLPSDSGESRSSGNSISNDDIEVDEEEDSGQMGVNPKLVVHSFPPPALREELYRRMESALLMSPAVNIYVFRARIEELCRWAEAELDVAGGRNVPHGSGAGAGNEGTNGTGTGNGSRYEPPPTTTSAPGTPFVPTMSFFAAASMGFAIAAASWLIEKDMPPPKAGFMTPNPADPPTGGSPGPSSGAFVDRSMPPPPARTHGEGSASASVSSAPSSPPERAGSAGASVSGSSAPLTIDPAFPSKLYRLAKLALGLALERAGYDAFDLDYIHARCLQARYLLLSHHGLGEGASMVGGLGVGRRRKVVRRGKGRKRAQGVGEGGDAVMEDASSTSQIEGGRGKGKAPARGPTLALAPEMVGVISDVVGNARMMGLNHDPDIAGGEKLSLYDKEMRRRLWWEVVTLDVFVADCLGEDPFIQEGRASTQLPSDTDEESFGPDSANLPAPNIETLQGNIDYFIQKCRLVKLGKELKRKVNGFREGFGNSCGPELYELVKMIKSEMGNWVKSLPDHLKLKDVPPVTASSFNLDPKLLSPSSSKLAISPADGENPLDDSPYLIAMRCDLAIAARHMFVSLCLPFMKSIESLEEKAKETSESDDFTQSESKYDIKWIYDSLEEPAMRIVKVWKYSHAVFRHIRPSMFMCYSFTKELFDAAVVLGHIAIERPRYAADVLVSLRAASEVIRDPSVLTGRRSVSAVDSVSLPSEAVRIIEELILKAEVASGAPSTPSLMKRKHEEVDGAVSDFLYHFRFPFVGTGVTIGGPPAPSSAPAATPALSPLTDGSAGAPKTLAEAIARGRSKQGQSAVDNAGDPRPAATKLKSSHPTISIRNRGQKGSRARANSSASQRSDTSHMYPPTSLRPSGPSAHQMPPHGAHGVPGPPHRMSSVEPPNSSSNPSLIPPAYPLSSTPGPPSHYPSPPGASSAPAGEYGGGFYDGGFPPPSSGYGGPYPPPGRIPPLAVPSQPAHGPVSYEPFSAGGSSQGGRMSMGNESSSYTFQSAPYEAMTNLSRPPSDPPQEHQFTRAPSESRPPGPGGPLVPPMHSLEPPPQQQSSPHPLHPPQTFHPHPHPQVQIQTQSGEPMSSLTPSQESWPQNATSYQPWNYYQ